MRTSKVAQTAALLNDNKHIETHKWEPLIGLDLLGYHALDKQ